MFKQAHSPKYTEICKYNRSFKTLRGLGWVNLNCQFIRNWERVQPSCFTLDWRCHVHAIKISFSPDSSLSSATDCHLGQEVKAFYEILARFYYHFITHPSNRRRNPKFLNHTAVESVKQCLYIDIFYYLLFHHGYINISRGEKCEVSDNEKQFEIIGKSGVIIQRGNRGKQIGYPLRPRQTGAGRGDEA